MHHPRTLQLVTILIISDLRDNIVLVGCMSDGRARAAAIMNVPCQDANMQRTGIHRSLLWNITCTLQKCVHQGCYNIIERPVAPTHW